MNRQKKVQSSIIKGLQISSEQELILTSIVPMSEHCLTNLRGNRKEQGGMGK